MRAGIAPVMMSCASSASSSSTPHEKAAAMRLRSTVTKAEKYCTSAFERMSAYLQSASAGEFRGTRGGAIRQVVPSAQRVDVVVQMQVETQFWLELIELR